MMNNAEAETMPTPAPASVYISPGQQDQASKRLFYFCGEKVEQVEEVKKAISEGADVNKLHFSSGRSGHRKTAMHRAAKYGHEEIIRILVSKGANINLQDDEGHTPLYDAYVNQTYNANLLKTMLSLGADPLVISKKSSLTLHEKIKDDDVFDTIIDDYAWAVIRSQFFDCCIHSNIEKLGYIASNPVILEEIKARLCEERRQKIKPFPVLATEIKSGINLPQILQEYRYFDLETKNSQGKKGLELAIEAQNLPAVQLLLREGAQIDLDDSAIKQIDSSQIRHEIQKFKHNPALHQAIQSEDEGLIQRLCNRRAFQDIDQRNQNGDTALHLAAALSASDVIKTLLKNKADITKKNNDEKTPYDIAKETSPDAFWLETINPNKKYPRRNENVVKEQFTYDVFNNLPSQKGEVFASSQPSSSLQTIKQAPSIQALQKAIEQGDVDFIRKQLEINEISINQSFPFIRDTKEENRTPLYWAAQWGQLGIVEFLLGQKDVDVEGHAAEENRPPLFTAVKHGRIDVVKALVRHGAKVNYVGKEGWTPLHVAARSSQVTTTKFLLKHGARVYAQNDEGQTAFDVAQTYNAQAVAALLEKAHLSNWIDEKIGADKVKEAKEAALQALSKEDEKAHATDLSKKRQTDIETFQKDIRSKLKSKKADERVLLLQKELRALKEKWEKQIGNLEEDQRQKQHEFLIYDQRLLCVESFKVKFETYEVFLHEKMEELSAKEWLKGHPKLRSYAETYCALFNGTYTAALVVQSGFIAPEAQGKAAKASGVVDALSTATDVISMVHDFTDAVPVFGSAVSVGLALVKKVIDNRATKEVNNMLDHLLKLTSDPNTWYTTIETVARSIVQESKKSQEIQALEEKPTHGWRGKVTDLYRKFADWLSTDPKQNVVEKYAVEDALAGLSQIFTGEIKDLDSLHDTLIKLACAPGKTAMVSAVKPMKMHQQAKEEGAHPHSSLHSNNPSIVHLNKGLNSALEAAISVRLEEHQQLMKKIEEHLQRFKMVEKNIIKLSSRLGISVSFTEEEVEGEAQGSNVSTSSNPEPHPEVSLDGAREAHMHDEEVSSTGRHGESSKAAPSGPPTPKPDTSGNKREAPANKRGKKSHKGRRGK